jgi:hypothetical protein
MNNSINKTREQVFPLSMRQEACEANFAFAPKLPLSVNLRNFYAPDESEIETWLKKYIYATIEPLACASKISIEDTISVSRFFYVFYSLKVSGDESQRVFFQGFCRFLDSTVAMPPIAAISSRDESLAMIHGLNGVFTDPGKTIHDKKIYQPVALSPLTLDFILQDLGNWGNDELGKTFELCAFDKELMSSLNDLYIRTTNKIAKTDRKINKKEKFIAEKSKKGGKYEKPAAKTRKKSDKRAKPIQRRSSRARRP